MGQAMGVGEEPPLPPTEGPSVTLLASRFDLCLMWQAMGVVFESAKRVVLGPSVTLLLERLRLLRGLSAPSLASRLRGSRTAPQGQLYKA